MAISSEDQTKLLKGVIGLFDAAAGMEINAQLENAVDNGLSIPEVLNILTTKTEFTDGVMGSATTSAEQAAVLAGNFGLTADGVEGSPATQAIDFFEDGIDAGTEIGTLVYQAVVYLMRSDLPAEFAETAQLLDNKAAVAAAYNAEASSSDLATMQAVLDDPLINGSGPISQDDIDQVLANAGVGIPDSFTLTNQTDIATANHFVSGLVFTPGGNDRINALQDEDILTGAGPNPSLTATLGNANDNGATIITPTLIGLETLNASFTGSGGGAVTALDMQDSNGLMSVNINRVSQAVNTAEIGNIEDSTVNNLAVRDTNANDAGIVEFSYSAGTLAGDNSVSLEVDNVQVAALNIGQNTSGIAARGVGTQGYENITLNSTGATNAIGTFNIPMDTGTAGVLTITGDTDLTLGASINAVNVNNNTLVEVENLFVAGTGIAQAGSRIATIDASALDGNFTVVLDNILDVGKAGTSSVDQDVTVTGGNGDDTFVLYDVVQTGDTIDGGAGGNDTLLFYSGSALNSMAANIDNASMFGDGSIGNLAADFDNLPDVTAVSLRNISTELAPNGTFTDAGSDLDAVLENLANAPVSFTLTNLTDTQATGITVHHATTANNQIQNTIINAAVASDTSDDTLGITLNDGTNVDPRFNFSIVTALPSNPSAIENVTLGDDDTESNSVELTSFAAHTGTVTITGGEAGDFFNLDVDTAGADLTAVRDGGTNVAGATADTGEVQQGLLGLDTDGTAVDATAGHFFDVSGVATQVRLGAATIDASGSAADVILRVGTNAASPVGAQDISTGTGDDTVIFDNLNGTRAGLTISDSVNAGDGDDTLVIDGTGVRISLGASEWTNVSNFEHLQIIGTSAAPVSTLLGQNAYNLTLTNDLIQANGGGMLNIINDNDANNDQSGVSTGTFWLDTAGTGAESGVTIDARTLNAQNHFTYNGEEGATRTADRFMFTDANINGGNTIDGGAVDNLSDTNSAANGDIMEVRNTATVTAGDMQGLSNIGNIAGVNDQAVAQTLDLELTDAVIDSLVDSYHTATTLEVETVNVRLNAAADIAAPVAGMGLTLDATGMSGKTAANVTLDAGFAVTDTIKIGQGLLTVNNFVIGGEDRVQLSVSEFGLTLDADDIGFIAGTDNNVDGTNILFGGAGAVALAPTDRIIFEDDLADTNIYFDADGNGAGAQVLVATIVGGTGLVAADVDIVA
ncbi:beta strand repeat-containing protein [Nitrosomonas marina]|uniref:Uncharacterized protein n=1 Tax=Nitrosomonas marina TaxID=917 RepID=A0A1H8D8U0_9PROT|nr:hypothetical protein [Nitrosomonas marina]SEN03576.1 hypothetical protein SAMN05216325_106108 [Nitrosomonas marina]